MSDKFFDYAQEAAKRFYQEGFEAEADLTDRQLKKKVREAQVEQWNYILVVGQEEMDNGTV